MATLFIAAAVNIGVGLLFNALFPPPDVDVEGPRLAELGFTSAAYGKFVNITFGTDRVDGNIIDTPDPAIEEVVNVESQSGGKGGGQRVNSTTYTYFLTCRVSFCIEGAVDLIRLWGDGKLIFDATGTNQLIRNSTDLIFYPGGASQIQDPEEVARRGSNIPAYRHLTTIKINRMPLADFGNRIPNFTAEVAFDSTISTPFLALDEPAGLQPPGSLTGSDTSRFVFDPIRNYLVSLKSGGTGLWIANASTLEFISFVGNGGGFSEPGYGLNGFVYAQTGTSNAGPLQKIDVETGTVVQQFGSGGGFIFDQADPPAFGNSGQWTSLQVTIPGVGVKSLVFHQNGIVLANGAVVDGDTIGVPAHIFSLTDGIPNELMDEGLGIPDHDRGVWYYFTKNTAQNRYELFRVVPAYAIGLTGATLASITITKLRDFTRGTVNDDFNGTSDPSGWAVNRTNGDLMLANEATVVLYNPITDTLLAKRQDDAFRSYNNYYSGSIMAYGRGPGAEIIKIVDTRDLSLIKSVNTDTIGWPGSPGDGVFLSESLVWDDRVQALFLSRVQTGSTAPVDGRVIKFFVNRVLGKGVGLDFIVQSLSTTYQRQTMAGLSASDIDVSNLASDIVFGYTINRQSTMRSALEPLRKRYFFDGVQSDWIIKFPKRGQSPVLTIPEENVGILKRGRDQTDEPAIREIRQDDLALPMTLAIRYKNKDHNFQTDFEQDKRHLFPNPTMRSKNEQTVDIPLVATATEMKQTAQKQLWTLWNERVSYKTIIPWTYLKLDSTDVFNMGVFGETVQLRMAENDIGSGWAIDITGVVEDTKSFSSTLQGGAALGNVAPSVPSSLPTRLIALDAPLLSIQDLLLTPISNAYMSVSGFENSWPGATVMKSIDDVAYSPTGTADVQSVVAAVRSVPGAWGVVNGEFNNRIQEVSEGGSMIVSAIRGITFWASTTEFNMLTGGNNTIAVIGTDGEVEIISYVDVIDNGDNTFTLQRLLRGRLGTEDIADGGMSVGDRVIGLRDSTGAAQDAGITRQRLSLTDLDVSRLFKGVTIGTLIEDASPISFTYTGRDLKPYSPVGTFVTLLADGGLTVDWERRTRAPFSGEWLDGTGTIPLNETIEKYEVTLNSTSAGDFITRVVDNATVTAFTQAEIALGGLVTEFALGTNWATPDGNMPSGVDPIASGNWVIEAGFDGVLNVVNILAPPQGSVTAQSPQNTVSTDFLMLRTNGTATVEHIVRQDISLAALGIDPNDAENLVFFMNLWAAQDRVDGGVRADLQLLDGDGNIVSSGTTGEQDIGPGFGVSYGDWVQIGSTLGQTFNGVPLTMPGAKHGATLRVRLFLFKRGTTISVDRSFYDEVALQVVSLPPGLTSKIVQVSETGKKSPVHQVQHV